MEKTIKLTENASKVLEFLKTADRPMTGAEIAEATGINPKGIHGVISQGLIRNKGLVEKADKVVAPFVNKDGVTVSKEYVTYVISEAGLQYSPAE
jgi:hypothetical protein